jgi:NAD(P)H-dependent FMN reductase
MKGRCSRSSSSVAEFGTHDHLRQSLVFLDMPKTQQPEAHLGRAAILFEEADNLGEGSGKTFIESVVAASPHG